MKQRVFMLTKSIWVAAFLVSAAIFFSSCSEAKVDEVTTKQEIQTSSKRRKGIVYKPSPLAKEMRRMYENMKVVNSSLKANEEVSDSLLHGYEGILTAEATNPADITDEFKGFARGWLSEVEVLHQDPNMKNYNNVMNACVNCHESFCPGPIPKIKKLKLIP